MAWDLLPVDYTDAAWVGLKRYNQIDNEDGTISLQDVTVYSNKEKSFFGAKDANRMNEALNTLMSMVENGTDLYEAFQNYFANQKDLFEAAANVSQEDFNAYIESLKADADTTIEGIKTDYAEDMQNFQNQQEELFQLWFDYVKGQLGQDVAGNLLNEILAVKETADAAKAITDTRGQAGGLATLDANGKLKEMPNLADVGGSNPNLLHNWYFADPIDQRQGYIVPPDTPYYSDTALSTQVGTVSEYTTAVKVDDTYGTITVSSTTYYVAWSAAVRGYAGGAAAYGPDRWILTSNAIVKMSDNGVIISRKVLGTSYAMIYSRINPSSLLGKTVTLSAIINDRLYTVTGTIPVIIPSGKTAVLIGEKYNSVWVQAYFVNGFLEIGPVNQSDNDCIFKAVKLELGEHQTLAHQDSDENWVLNDPPPDKNMELIKCCMSTADSSDTYANKKTAIYTCGTDELTEGISKLETGMLYFMYE